MGFFKVLKQPVRKKYRKYMKYALKRTRHLISIFIVNVDLYEHVLTTSLEKWKTYFPRLYSWSLWNQLCFAASPKLFAQKPWNFCEVVFIETPAKTDVSAEIAG